MTPNDILAIFCLFGFVFSSASDVGASVIRERYKKKKWTPPSWVFDVVWFVLYVLISTAAFFFWYGKTEDWTYYTGLAAVFANAMFNRYWTRIYFVHRQYYLAIADILAILVTAVIFCAMCAVHFPLYTHMIAFFLFIPYILWTITAFVMTVYIGPLPAQTCSPLVQR